MEEPCPECQVCRAGGQAGAAKTEEAVEISLTPEAVERAGIKITEARTQSSVSA